MDIAANIKKRRRRLGISQQDLAEFAEVGIATVKDIERGKGNPSLQTLQKILAVLGLEMVLQVRNTLLTEDKSNEQ
ncbi:MAG: transcriptional regulator [Bacteroidetes bacterium]|nr:transcriptional regulator [Bacteroidota bacterium]MBQ9509464.1 helix-turn-helix transcriptional regulator [Bacteroidales bacterium]